MISFKEDHISQIPALLMLEKFGYTYLTPDEALALRGGNLANVLLEPVLRKQLAAINVVQVSSMRTTVFSEQNITAGIDALRNIPMDEGFMEASQTVYDLLTSGKTLEQIVDGDRKSFVMQYIDWKNPRNNVFHVTEEFAVSRTGMTDTYRPDIVLFVNGIPLCVIECKRPDVKDSIEQAISAAPPQPEGRRYPFVVPLLDAAAGHQPPGGQLRYARPRPKSSGRGGASSLPTARRRPCYRQELERVVNEPLLDDKLFGERFDYVHRNFEDLYKQPVTPSVQDEYLYSLCRPERLLQLMYGFTLYDDGIKKVARYQQYFAVRQTMQRIRHIEGGRRRGGVIWHTQGSGKSLTMAMLAQAIILDKEIRNPKIILVTDRTDLDRQITGTFRKCQIRVENATTGSKLVELLNSKSDAVITTIINKFETAVRGIRTPLTDPNIFVLIDEGHRSQYGEMGIKMEKTLPNACFIAMTGTPLMKKEKNTARKFGGIIQPVYTVDQAVADKAVVPLLYEGRMVPQVVHEETIDRYFDKICGWMSDAQRADMKKKFSRADQLNQTQQRIYAIAWDISQHFRENWQGSKFKAQLVAPRKRIAILYKQYLDEIGIVSSEVLITSPDTREGEDEAFGETSNVEVAFWKRMMDEYGTAKKYEASIINRFKNSDKPEIIIVVDKLLTGFDEPRNTVLYLDRKLKDHTLLQAIARVNRVCEDKEFGYIIDYYGVLGSLNSALELYTDFDKEDLEGTYTDILEEVAELPPEACRVVGPLQGGAQHNRLRGLRQCPARGGPAHALLRKAAGLCPDAEGSAFVHRIPSKHASRRGRTVQARSGLLRGAPDNAVEARYSRHGGLQAIRRADSEADRHAHRERRGAGHHRPGEHLRQGAVRRRGGENLRKSSQSRHDCLANGQVHHREHGYRSGLLQEVLADAQGDHFAIRTRANRRGRVSDPGDGPDEQGAESYRQRDSRRAEG